MKKYGNDLNDVFTRFYIVVCKFEIFFPKNVDFRPKAACWHVLMYMIK